MIRNIKIRINKLKNNKYWMNRLSKNWSMMKNK